MSGQQARKNKGEKKGRTSKTQLGAKDAQVTCKTESNEGIERGKKANEKEEYTN